MPAYVAYIDHELARQVATGLIGSQVSLGRQRGRMAGVNFKVIFNASDTSQESTTTSLDDLLPELLVQAISEAVHDTADTLDEVRTRLLAGSDSAFLPGSPLLLRHAQLSAPTPEVEMGTTANLAGEACGVASLSSGSFGLQAYVRSADIETVADLYGEPVEVMGVLRYTKPYRISGAAAVNLGLRVVAIWLR